MKFFKKRKIIIGVLILIFIGIFVYVRLQTSQTAGVKTYKVKTQTLKEELTLSGEIAATEHITLRFQSSGLLAWVGVKEGDYVQKGQAIASLDQTELKKRLNKYLAAYSKSRSSFDQQQDNNRDPVLLSLTEAQRREALRAADRAQQDLNSSVLDVELQTLALQYSTLTSPIEGVVVRVAAPNAGVNITPTQAEFEIVNPNTLYFSVLADQTEVTQLQTGQSAGIVFDAYPDKDAGQGSIYYMAYTPQSGETGTVYEVRLGFDHYNAQYRLGMTGDANFILREKQNAVAVPLTYIKTDNGKKYVLKKQGTGQTKNFITTGETFDTLIEVTSGLQAGDVIYD